MIISIIFIMWALAAWSGAWCYNREPQKSTLLLTLMLGSFFGFGFVVARYGFGG